MSTSERCPRPAIAVGGAVAVLLVTCPRARQAEGRGTGARSRGRKSSPGCSALPVGPPVRPVVVEIMPSVLRGCVRAPPPAPRATRGARRPGGDAGAVRDPRSASGSPGPARPGAASPGPARVAVEPVPEASTPQPRRSPPRPARGRELCEVGGEGVFLERSAVEPGVEAVEGHGVGPAGVRADGGLSARRRGRGAPGLEAVDAGLELAVRCDPDESGRSRTAPSTRIAPPTPSGLGPQHLLKRV